MHYGESEYQQLKFLTQYGFEIENHSNGKYIDISCTRDDCCITYHEWPQFNDFDIIITKTYEDRENYKFLRFYGDCWFQNHVLPKYRRYKKAKKYSRIELVVFYLQNQVQQNKNIFGIELNKKNVQTLNAKEKSNCTHLDNVRSFYENNNFYNLLSNHGATEIKFCASSASIDNSIKVFFTYYNLCVFLEFREKYYKYYKHKKGYFNKKSKKNIIKELYTDEFNAENFIERFIDLLKNERLSNRSRTKTNCIIAFAIVVITTYLFVFNWRLLLAMTVPLFIWLILEIKSHKNK